VGSTEVVGMMRVPRLLKQKCMEWRILGIKMHHQLLGEERTQTEGMALKYFGIMPSECIMRCVYVFGVNKERVT
jgi:hypothetical protein